MKSALNIIHLHTFRMSREEGSLVIGEIEEFKERDRKISSLVSMALEKGVPVLHHRFSPIGTIPGIMEDLSLTEGVLEVILDSRIKVFLTLENGLPITEDIEEVLSWDLLKEAKETGYIFADKFESYMPHADYILFIGGMIEKCIMNVALYCRENIYQNGQTLLYIPELCASCDCEEKEGAEKKLKRKNILPISYEQVIKMISNGN